MLKKMTIPKNILEIAGIELFFIKPKNSFEIVSIFTILGGLQLTLCRQPQ